jgi:hypothetical protein
VRGGKRKRELKDLLPVLELGHEVFAETIRMLAADGWQIDRGADGAWSDRAAGSGID